MKKHIKTISNLFKFITIMLMITGIVIINIIFIGKFGEQENIKKTEIDGEYWIPKGFIEADDSARTIKKGKVIEDRGGNQFVWIPCYVENGVISSKENLIEYKRRDFGKGSDFILCSEEQNIEELESIKKYGGFYIGRYEAGKDKKNNVVIKQNQNPYNYVTISESKEKSSNFANINKYDKEKMYTNITSSYAWDTTLTYIENEFSEYGTFSPQGNYLSPQLLKTGQTEPVCNIYDMGGNLWEYTTEKYDDTLFQYVTRGGNFYVVEIDS